MKIDVNQIPQEGLTLEEEFTPLALDLETYIIKFQGPVKIKADVSKITNAITVILNFNAVMRIICSRCLEEFKTDFKKNISLNYPALKSEPVIDLNPDIREEIILDYPIKPLCKPDCLGLCLECGMNLNLGKCSCQ